MKVTLPEVEKRKACKPGLEWFAENHKDGIELDSLVEELRGKGITDWIGWLAFSLELTPAERVALAKKGDFKSRGVVALKAPDLTDEERFDLLKEAGPAYVGTYLKTHPGAPAWLLDYCNGAWRKKIERLEAHGLLKLNRG